MWVCASKYSTSGSSATRFASQDGSIGGTLPAVVAQQFAHLFVGRLREIVVPEADRVERVRSARAHDRVHVARQLPARLARGDRHRDDDAPGALLLERLDR